MIITRTPLRVSFVGGGSDLPSFYRKHSGKVISTSIDKYVYVNVNHLSEYFDCSYLLKYSKTEMCNSIDEISHPIIRETLRKLNIKERLEITSMADLPAGTGLGSSSSYTVGLLHALYAYQGKYVSKEALAQEACEIEIEILKEPIGKQDQYAASYGGLRVIKFNKDDTVETNPVICSKETKNELSKNLLMFYTGVTRNASGILSEQKKKTEEDVETQEKIASILEPCSPFLSCLSRGSTLSEIGYILHTGWNYKKSLVSSISNKTIDDYYSKALEVGAVGGKLLGAGGGGCLLFYVEPQNHENIRRLLYRLREVNFNFENEGTKIIYVSD